MMCCLLWGCKPTLYLGPKELPKEPNGTEQQVFPNPIYQLKDILLDVYKTEDDFKQYKIKTLKRLNSNETDDFYFTGSCIHIPLS